MRTFVEKIIEGRLNLLLDEVEQISKTLVENETKETISVIELANKGILPKNLEKRLKEINLIFFIFNTLLPKRDSA